MRTPAADSLPKSFDPFFTTKATGHSVGLVLADIKGIVESHNGAVRAFSSLEGTRVEAILPAQQRTATLNPEAPPNAPKILLLDDEEMIGQHLERLLRKQGYHALRLQSPVEALSLFPPKTPTDADNPTEEPASQTWSLIITDNAMPRVDGITFVKTLRERGFDTKVVMLTGHLPPPPETLQELDIETIIAKPINIKDFIKLIQEQLAQEPSSSI